MGDAARIESGRATRSGQLLHPNRAAELLEMFRTAHEGLLAALAVMEGLTGDAVPDPGLYAAARWKLSAASRQRRKLATEICAELIESVAAGEAEAIEKLLAEDAAQARRSAAHIQQWTISAIGQDWAGYCRASAVLRAAMRDRITADRKLLYPLLEKCSR